MYRILFQQTTAGSILDLIYSRDFRLPRECLHYARWQEEGKNRRKSLGTSNAKIARTRFNHFQRELTAGKIKPLDTGIAKTLSEFTREFLESIEKTRAAQTVRLYADALEKARTSWGNIQIRRINTRRMDQFQADLVKSGLARPTVNKNMRHLKAAIKTAQEWDYAPLKVRFPKPLREKPEVRYIPVEDLRKIMGQIRNPEFSNFCMLSACTGLRSGELLRLTWSDVDNPPGFIRISPEQKNREESRIPVNATARAAMDRLADAKKTKPANGRIFTFKDQYTVSRLFKAAARAAGLGQFRFHDLRHSFASHLAMAGKDATAIKDLMRHKSITSTMIYAKLSPDHLKQVSEAINYGPMPIPSAKTKG